MSRSLSGHQVLAHSFRIFSRSKNSEILMSGGLAASRDSSSDRAGRFEERILNENCCSCKAFTQPLKLRALQMDERETCGVAVRGEASLPVCRIPMQFGLHVRPRATSPDISNI